MDFNGDIGIEDDPPNTNQLQKPLNLIRHLPFKDDFEKNRQKFFSNLKSNLIRSIANKGSNLKEWISAFNNYRTLYGYSFTKDEHVFITKVCYQALVNFESDLIIIPKLCDVLVFLLKKPQLLSRNDLELDWRPLFELSQKTIFSPGVKSKTVHLSYSYNRHLYDAIKYCRVYFNKNATSEMLEEWKAHLCIHDNKFYKYIEYFSLFLPTLLYPHEHDFGFKLWLEDFMTLWISFTNSRLFLLESHFLSLFSRLAEDANGFIDWDPYMPAIFERFMSMLNEKTVSMSYFATNSVKSFVHWIIYMISPHSICLENLNKFSNIRSYTQIVNNETQFSTIISHLLEVFIKRLRKELYKKDWHLITPSSHLITDKIKHKFSLIFKEKFLVVYFDKFQVLDFYNLVSINPKLFAAYTFEKLQLACEQINEPKRLETSLRLLSVSLFPIFIDEIGHQYRRLLLQILSNLTNSINTNDENLCYFHIYVIGTIFELGLPLIDCSGALSERNDLDDDQLQLCIDSAQLEDFSFQFLNCCFNIIESNNEHLFKMKYKDLSMETLIFDTFSNILDQTSATNCKLLIDKLFSYATSNIFEEIHCCSMLVQLVGAAIWSNPSYSMQLFFNYVYNLLLSITNNVNKLSDLSKCEFFYNLELLHTCFTCRAEVLCLYQAEIIHLIKEILKIDLEENKTDLIRIIFFKLFYSLTNPRIVSQSFCSKLPDFKENVPILNWPKLLQFESSSIDWHAPDSNAVDFAKILFETFLKSHIDRLDEWSKSEKIQISKSDLHKSLSIICSSVSMIIFLPNLKSYHNVESEYDSATYLNDSDNIFTIDFDGYNLREELVRILSSVVGLLKNSLYDNIDTLEIVIRIFRFCLFPYDIYYDSPSDFQKKLSKPLAAKFGLNLPSLHLKQMMTFKKKLLREYSMVFNSKLTPALEVAIGSMLTLSTCCYSQIRRTAQTLLLKIFKQFPRSIEIVLPRLVSNIQNATHYEDYIGTLYLISKNYDNAILFHNNFQTLIKLWPLLVTQNKFAEKPRIIEFFDKTIPKDFRNDFYSPTITRNNLTENISSLFPEAIRLNFDVLSPEEVQSYDVEICELNKINQKLYYQLIDNLVQSLGQPKLHWRFYNFGLSLLNYLIRSDIPFSQNAIEFFFDNLIHDSIDIRSIATKGCIKILKPEKRHLQLNCDQISRLELVDCYANEELFTKTTFFDKHYVGYFNNVPYVVSNLILKNSLNCFIVDRFKSEQFLDKLIDFLSLDNSKKIYSENVTFWKYLFQNYKLFNSDLLYAKIEVLLSKGKYNSDKCAIEILSGLILASNHFDYNEISKTKIFLIDIFSKNLSNFNSESNDYWGYFFQCLFVNRDIRRNLWVGKLVLDEKRFADNSPYYQSAFLNFTFYASHKNWKFNQYNQSVLTFLENHLCNDYQNVRQSIGILLSSLFIADISLNCAQRSTTSNSMRQEFIKRIIVRLNSAMASLFVSFGHENYANITGIKSGILNYDSKEGKQLIHLIETICYWIDSTLRSQFYEISDFIPLLPYLCLVQTSNATLVSQITVTVTKMANVVHRSENIDQILQIIVKASKNWNWHSRKLVVMFIRYFVFNNYFTLEPNKEWVDSIVEVVVDSLHDEMPEVRDSACLSLSGLISMNFICSKRIAELIGNFKAESIHNDTQTRHGAILGLCSFVYAYPLDIPPILPDILLFLIDYLSAPQTISKSIKSAINSFKKSHTTNWIEHKKKFTPDQLSELSNILISPSYYS